MTPDLMYFLQSQRLGFRRWRADDFELARALWGDPQIARYIVAGVTLTDDQVRERLSSEIQTQEDHGIQYWPIFLLTDHSHVGCCGLRPYQPDERILEIGVHIRAEWWGRGLAFEATQTVRAHAFGKLSAQALFAGHNPQNNASRALVKKLGFRYTHDEFYAPTGLNHPSYLLTAEEYAAQRCD